MNPPQGSAPSSAAVPEAWTWKGGSAAAEDTVHGRFARIASTDAARIALRWMGGELSYGELDARANALAMQLLAAGIVAEEPVGVCMDRSAEAIVALLAVLKAGKTYVPLDPSYPDSRLALLLADAGIRRVLTSGRCMARLQGLPTSVIRVDESRAPVTLDLPACSSATRAYIMYTSGSTGAPKGVQIEHGSILRLVVDVDYVRLDASTCFLHAAPLGFDASTLEIWGPLLNGGSLAILEEALPSGPSLASLISGLGVNTAWLTAGLFNALVDTDVASLRGLRQLLTGGEALSPPHVRRALVALPDTQIINGYGPTECTTFAATYAIPRELPASAASVPIGGPVAATRLVVLDAAGRPVLLGHEGELYIGGRGVARGYLSRPELDRQRFVELPGFPGERFYRTGDLVRWREDGVIDFVGRADQQVKLRGYRIELGEIEARLAQLPGVRACAVAAHGDGPADRRLVAYCVMEHALDAAALRAGLARDLPEFMVPVLFQRLDALPVTPNGKLDRRALPAPTMQRPAVQHRFELPRGDAETAIAAIFARLLGLDAVGRLDGFMELGGTSLQVLQVLRELRDSGLGELSVAAFFAAPTVSGMAAQLAMPAVSGPVSASKSRTAVRGKADEPIAIIGMAGRFPGASDVEAFWSNLCAGRESIRFFRPDELDASIPAEVRGDPGYVPARGVLDGVELFDAGFFGISPLEAQLMDPQQRHFLEVAWHAMEHAGHAPGGRDQVVGVFGGMYNASYFQRHLAQRPDVTSRLGELQVMLGNEKDYLTSRVAHKLGLSGPAVSVNTACSTSLVAAVMAMESLRNGSCTMALAGGVAITCPPASGYLYQEGSMASQDGHTRTFDTSAAGTVFSDGVGVVVLRRLCDALADGDTVYAVLLGGAVNNDGSQRASFTAPSPDGQAAVITAAQEAAGVDARSIGYVEAHGTATPLGDPIEIEGLTRAFRRHTPDNGFCAIGSLKSNVGHTVIAAGVAGLIKASLALHREQIPPTVNFTAPNPQIDFARTPFRVQAQLDAWPRTGKPRRAAVSSFGFGGTNAHVVLEEAPVRAPSLPSRRSCQLLLLSARDDKALGESSAQLAAAMREDRSASAGWFADAAHTLRVGRQPFARRRFVVAADAAEAAGRLGGATGAPAVGGGETAAFAGDVVFLFPGQGSQYASMGRALHESEPAFRAAYDACCEALARHGFANARQLFFDSDPGTLTATSITQPALFCFEYALASLWMSWGVRPVAMIGHSIGEFVAATIAGVMGLEDALAVVAERGRLMQAQPAGSMLSVRLSGEELSAHLPAGVVVAAENAPGLCVASGPSDSIEHLEQRLATADIACRRLVTSHAFHSPMMDAVVAPMADLLKKIALNPPRIPVMSTVTAAWLTGEQAVSCDYWASHLRLPVRFGPALARLLAEGDRMLVEMGPRATLTALAQRAMAEAGRRGSSSALSSGADSVQKEGEQLAAAAGRAWCSGVDFDWNAFCAGEQRQRVPLPGYAFQRSRHWVDAVRASQAEALQLPAATPEPAAVTSVVSTEPAAATTDDPGRRASLIARIHVLIEEVSGADTTGADPDTAWLELGLDSLTLTQLALQLQRSLGVKVTFRQIMEDYTSVSRLAEVLESKLAPVPVASPAPSAPASTAPAGVPVSTPSAVTATGEEGASGAATYDVKKAFGAIARIHTRVDELTPRQRARLDALVARYTARTAKSKAYTTEHRPHMADPRVVNGFRPLTKELTYQIVIERSRGSRLWDIDGNEYIDVLQGFGMSMFGWQPDFIREAVHAQVDLGYEIGPQHVLAGETARLFCELTGAERAAFCNTGSEAVMGAMRIARTVTGRSTIAIFTGAYHGIFDEVIVRGTRKLRTIPAAPGILPESSQNMLVLEYGTPESLEILRQRADTLAAIVVEPVQSRRPDFAPVEFLRDLRKLTEEHGIVFVFDEVVTGFRSHPQGAQGLFGIQADLASYGKVVGGGFSIGVIAGKRRFMDALDGGHWQYGDDSIPTVGVTYFAGTFVRHPLALAASRAALQHMKAAGPALQEQLTARTRRMVERINADMAELGAPFRLNTFASLWRNVFTEDLPYADLIYVMLRDRGIHILDNFPCFLTTSHSDADIEAIVTAYREAAREMQAAGFFPVREAGRHAPAGNAGTVREVPSTDPQREIWLAASTGPEASLAYNESVTLHLHGDLRQDDFLQALQQLVGRHDSLRASFSQDGASLRMPVDPSGFGCSLLDLSAGPAPLSRLADLIDRHVREAFDLSRGPLVRADLVRLAERHHALVLTGHHIVLDGWSFWVLLKELAALYRGETLPPAPSFADYARRAAARAGSREVEESINWWVAQFPDGGPTLSLPVDRPRPRLRTQAAARIDHVLPAGLIAAVRAAGTTAKASLFATLLSAFAGLLGRLSGQDDLVVGIPAAGQAADGEDALVGHAVNILPLRFRLDPQSTFSDLLATGRRTMLDAYDHQGVTFGRLLQALPVSRDPSRLPLVSVLFNIDQAMSGDAARMPGIDVEFQSNARAFETFELFVNAVDLGTAGMRLECQYNTDLFDTATVARWMEAFERLLGELCAQPQASFAAAALLGNADRAWLAKWNSTGASYPAHLRIEACVASQIQARGSAVAVRAADGNLTYDQLGALAAAVCVQLGKAGLRPGGRVGLLVERDRMLLPALLGALQAGVCYVPLDASFPADRLAYMLADAGLEVVISSRRIVEASAGLLAGRTVVLVDDLVPVTATLPAHGLSAAEDAYVIYTSGSTGRPKGVRVQHTAVVNFLASMRNTPGFTPGSKLLAVTTVSFDIAVLELLLPLVSGGEVVLATREQAHDGVALRQLLEAQSVNVMQATPATWRLLLASGWQGSTDFKALCGGEALSPGLASSLLERVGELWNMYGPTETTVWSSCHRVTSGRNPVPIGRAVANTTLHVLDGAGNVVPVGIVGELYIGGEGVTRGYLGREELTAEKFVRDEAARQLHDAAVPTSGVLYRTGDLARWCNDGTVECLGRTDFQVKLRGYRIELGEIESQLARLPGVREAVVVLREDQPGDQRLVAYLLADGDASDAGRLRQQLATILPDYMLPAHYVALDTLPLTGSGKVDRRRLPAPRVELAPASAADSSPLTEGEKHAAREFGVALSLPRVGRHDNFFMLGGHSLLAAQLAARLSRELDRPVPMSVLFEHPTPAALGGWLERQQASGTAAPAPIRPGGQRPAPLSLMQQRVWYLEQVQPGTSVFNVPSAHRLRGKLDADALEQALASLIARQPSLRTVVQEQDGEPVQVELPHVAIRIEIEDLSRLAAGEQQARLQQRLQVEAGRSFDPRRAPLFRTRLFRLGPDDHVLFFMAHHLIWDGWSFDLFYEEMAELYAAASESRQPRLPALPVSYADFSLWHRDWMKGALLDRQLAYWRQKLAGAPDALELPVDRPRPAVPSGDGGTVWIRVPAETAGRLRAAAKEESATLFMTLLTAWSLALHRLTGQHEVVIGTPVRGRSHPEVEKLMGFFVNAIPLRLAVRTHGSFIDALREVRRHVVEAFGYQDVPFEHLVRVLGSARDQSRFPIYQTFFSYQDARGRPHHWGPLEHANVPVFQPSAAQDIALWFLDGADGLVGGLNYNSDILDEATVARMRDALLAMLEIVAAAPDCSLAALVRPGTEELESLRQWNSTDLPLPDPDRGLYETLGLADRPPGQVMLRWGAEAWTASDLRDAAGGIALRLQSAGVTRGDVVAVSMQRTPDLLAALLGVMRAGAAWLPMDPEFPAERLRLMLEDSGARVLLSDGSAALPLPPGIVEIDATRGGETGDASKLAGLPAAGGADLAYLLYTSGSTGRPKGVRVPQRAVVNFLESMRRVPGMQPGERLAAVTTVSFDISVLELLLPLVAGGEIVLVERELAVDGVGLRNLLESQRVDMLQATPATWRMLVEAGWRGGPGFKALCGGEALPVDLAEALLDRVGELWNMYGPTETTVWSTCARIEPGQGAISIGRPIGNTQVWILDEAGELLPIGVPGEICIGGLGVAEGYHRRPELTAQRFMPDTIGAASAGRLYRTGDIGRWRADGQLQHLGRRDYQVKLRGYRIEPGEIETALLREPEVEQCVVVARGADEHARLVAYCVLRDGDRLNEAGLRERLRRHLPDYMIPARFMALARLPLTPNGKVDRAALPSSDAPGESRTVRTGGGMTVTETTLANLWRELLQVPDVHAEDNFLDLGGHSLLIMRAVARIETATGVRVNPRSFVFQTIAQIAAEIDAARPAQAAGAARDGSPGLMHRLRRLFAR
jgi:amino acid adenylation domain-containing protein